ncbi:MAG: ABC transporter substrate-binding protein [Isosphaeraceae bacterium]
MLFALGRLTLGLTLIAAASGILLLMDLHRRAGGANRVPQVAIFQQASTPGLDEGVRGMIAGLAAKGYRDGETAAITRYNAEGDAATANAIAREITDGQFDVVLTSSTPSLQAVANANKDGRTIHVFGIVADPYIAGVGLKRENPLDHPRHLVGYGMFLPIDRAFELARKLYPGLKRVGVGWNPAEANSRRYTTAAREVCHNLGIDLLEAQVENTSGIVEAFNSIIARDAEAIWMGGDVTVSGAVDTILKLAKRARIPVFSILPGDPQRGTLFDMGIDYFEAGKLSGELAGSILSGEDPATIAIRDIVTLLPRRLIVNRRALMGLRDPWRIPQDVASRATTLVDESGVHEQTHGNQDTARP